MSIQFSDDTSVHPLMEQCEVQIRKGRSKSRKLSSEGSSSEDDVFCRDDHTSTRPLMAPRNRTKVRIHKPRRKCKPWVKPCIYCLVFLSSVGAVVCLVLYFLSSFVPAVFHFGNLPLKVPKEVVACTNIEVEDVWTVGYPKLLTESAFRLVDINQDGTLDVVFGFATGLGFLTNMINL